MILFLIQKKFIENVTKSTVQASRRGGEPNRKYPSQINTIITKLWLLAVFKFISHCLNSIFDIKLIHLLSYKKHQKHVLEH